MEGLNIEQLRIDARTVSRTMDNHPSPFGSWFEVDVFLKIIDRGYRAIPQFKVANYPIDIVIEGMRGRLTVECDGDEFHSTPEQIASDERRERILGRCGWTFWRVRGSEFYHDQVSAMESLWIKLQKLGIAPGGKDIDSGNNNLAKKNEPLENREKPCEFTNKVEQVIYETNEHDKLQHTLNGNNQQKSFTFGSTSRKLKQTIVSV